MPREAKPTTTTTPIVTTATWEEFEKFQPQKGEKRRTWLKEALEKAREGPVKVEGLTRGRMLALIRNAYRNKLEIKYDMKRGVAILAPLRLKQ